MSTQEIASSPTKPSSTGYLSILMFYLFPIFNWIINLAKSISSVPVLNSTTTSKNNTEIEKKTKNLNDSSNERKNKPSSSHLFPGSFKLFKNLKTQDLNECSTNYNSQLISFTNPNGELEFKLVDNSKPDQLQQQLSPISDISSPHNIKISNESKKLKENSLELSVKPNNEDGQAEEKEEEEQEGINKDQDDDEEQNDFLALSPVSSVKSSNPSLNNESDDNIANESDDNIQPGEKVHECPHCDSKFRIRGYLTRHMKKHSQEKAYRCPFYDSNSSQKCHVSGGFSRRDTYKTHLKARHFKYPPGIKSGARIGMTGWCGICGEKFVNNEVWVERHIEMGSCPGLPEAHIKSLKIGKKKTGKHSKLLDVSTNGSNPSLSTTANAHNIISPSFHDGSNASQTPSSISRSPLSLNSSPSPQSSVSNSSGQAQVTPVFVGGGPIQQQQHLLQQQLLQQQQLASQYQLHQLQQQIQLQIQMAQQQLLQQQQQQQQQQFLPVKPEEISLFNNQQQQVAQQLQLLQQQQQQSNLYTGIQPVTESGLTQEEEEEFFESLDSESSPFTSTTKSSFYEGDQSHQSSAESILQPQAARLPQQLFTPEPQPIPQSNANSFVNQGSALGYQPFTNGSGGVDQQPVFDINAAARYFYTKQQQGQQQFGHAAV